MILLIGIWMSFTKKPMNPMIANPIRVARAIFWNSAMEKGKQHHNKLCHTLVSQYELLIFSFGSPFKSGLVHLLTSLSEFFAKSARGFT